MATPDFDLERSAELKRQSHTAYSHRQPSKTSWEVRHASGETSSTIRVSNLSTIISGPSDAWGRPNRPQPIQVSVEIAFTKPFSTTSSGDELKGDTIHYGILSKHVMKVLESSDRLSLSMVLLLIRESLLGPWISPSEFRGAGLLATAQARFVKVSAHLPKGTKLGDGVSLTDSMVLKDSQEGTCVIDGGHWGNMLKFHDLKVPVLIGVNENERTAKQLVIANVEIDRWAVDADKYAQVEEHITKASSRRTNETGDTLTF